MNELLLHFGISRFQYIKFLASRLSDVLTFQASITLGFCLSGFLTSPRHCFMFLFLAVCIICSRVFDFADFWIFKFIYFTFFCFFFYFLINGSLFVQLSMRAVFKLVEVGIFFNRLFPFFSLKILYFKLLKFWIYLVK